MKIEQAIRVLANTRIVHIPDPKQGGDIKAADSNFEKDDINNAFQEIIRYFVTNGFRKEGTGKLTLKDVPTPQEANMI